MGLPFIWRAQKRSEVIVNCICLLFVSKMDDILMKYGSFREDPEKENVYLEKISKEREMLVDRSVGFIFPCPERIRVA